MSTTHSRERVLDTVHNIPMRRQRHDAERSRELPPPWARWTEPPKAPEPLSLTPQCVRIIHPFHPLAGQEFEFVKRRKNWQVDRVYIYNSSGDLVSLPAEWTDVVAPDPFVVVSQGRSPFHLESLARLADLVTSLRVDHSPSVKRITP